MKLSHNENTLVVSFESINYQYQYDIQYQYYLEGYDRNWSKPSSNQLVRFVNLPSGSYVLHVKAICRSNGRELGETTLEIHIAQPWWNTWWAWIIYLCIFAAILYFVWQYYKERLQRKYYDEKINFFVNTAHNIRTPLSLVLAPLDNLANDSSLSEKSRGFLDMAHRNGNKLLKMVTELLDFQKVEQSAEQVRLQDIELPMLLRVQLEKFVLAAQEKHIQLCIETCPQQQIHSDVKMMDLILENLLSNAIKYTPKNSHIVIRTEKRGKQAIVSISDDGNGIADEIKPRIFDMFYSGANQIADSRRSLGLGLSLCKSIINAHGGELTVSDNLPHGTVFTFTLPAGEVKVYE